MITLKEKFDQLRKEKRKAFIPYVPFGFPSIGHTRDIVLALQAEGADAVELGLPFSDPVADGPIIQKASSIALRNGAYTDSLFSMVKAMRKDLRIPVALMTYYNPVFKFGTRRFFEEMKKSGITGILTVDLPVEEAGGYLGLAGSFSRETVFFITPVTPLKRAKKIIKSCSGFVYYISVTGTTGPNNFSLQELKPHVQRIKDFTQVPVCVGFGIHKPRQVAMAQRISDGAIVGSAIVKFISLYYRKKNFIGYFHKYLRSLIMH